MGARWLLPAALSALAHGALAAALIAIAPWGSGIAPDASPAAVEVEFVTAAADTAREIPQPVSAPIAANKPPRAPRRGDVAQAVAAAEAPDAFAADVAPSGAQDSREATAMHAAVTSPPALPTPPVGIADNPKPEYPLAARRRGIEGRVVVQAVVPPSGENPWVGVLRSSGHDVLDRAALAAIKNWRFRPATRDGQAIEAGVDIAVVFRLDN
jgi:periplasmic protein TonB